MSGRARSLASVIAVVVFAGVSQSCTSYQRPKGAIEFGSRARVESAVPFVISSGGVGTNGSCRATHAKGVVSRANADTIHLTDLRDVTATDETKSECLSLTRGTVFLSSGDQLKVRRFSMMRTGLLLGSIIGGVALAIGQADIGYGGGGTPGCGVVC
jgi:hypothetical protein